jgi:hypothetical protein
MLKIDEEHPDRLLHRNTTANKSRVQGVLFLNPCFIRVNPWPALLCARLHENSACFQSRGLSILPGIKFFFFLY